MSDSSKIRVVLQARTDSQRLPGKSMMLVSGYPLAVLAGLRAANTGLEVLFATTNRSLDDLLAEAAKTAGLLVYRGETNNVRKRIIDACEDLPEDAILVRLTGDNVLPDGALIDEIVRNFIAKSQVFCSTQNCPIPYGISVEVMRLGILRESIYWGQSRDDDEHVTPAISNLMSHSIPPVKHPDGDLSKYRCTVDTQSDFDMITNLFSKVDSPITVGWQTLISILVNEF